MNRLQDVGGTTLEWTQPSWGARAYELRADGILFATLQWEKLFGSLATARTADGEWTFKRGGFLRPRVTARVAGTEEAVAEFQADWGGGGTLTIAGRAAYEWKRLSFFGGAWGFTRPTGRMVAEFEPQFSVLKRRVEVRIAESPDSAKDLPLLVTLGWYLLVLMQQDSDAATVAAIS